MLWTGWTLWWRWWAPTHAVISQWFLFSSSMLCPCHVKEVFDEHFYHHFQTIIGLLRRISMSCFCVYVCRYTKREENDVKSCHESATVLLDINDTGKYLLMKISSATKIYIVIWASPRSEWKKLKNLKFIYLFSEKPGIPYSWFFFNSLWKTFWKF